ncbi:MAG: hypothetical protein JW966_14935 [Anaerolineae bacterium]|nr:hypothetical protein [Anaerolineae bacterium]
MTRRPDPFSQPKLEEVLLELGCPESFISSTISNYRLFVPLLFAELGEERILEIVAGVRDEFGLADQHNAWRTSARHLVAWAKYVIDDYRIRRQTQITQLPPKDDQQQPRLF